MSFKAFAGAGLAVSVVAGVVIAAHVNGAPAHVPAVSSTIAVPVAIATVPTMLAGIYGTNFHSVPELEASVHFGGRGGGYEFYYGYYLMIAVLATIGVLLWRAFKKSGWL